MLKKFIYVITMTFSIGAFAGDTVYITERSLKNSFIQENYNVEELEILVKEANLQKEKLKGRYDLLLKGSFNHLDNRQKSSFVGQPVTTNSLDQEMSLNKTLGYGVSFSTGINNSNFKNLMQGNETNNASLTSFLNIEVDLWKNFLGRYEKLQDYQVKSAISKAKLNKSIQKNNLWTSVRELYWDIVLNNETLKMQEKNLKNLHYILKLTKEKRSLAIADEYDIAFLKNKITIQSTAILQTKYTKESLFNTLKKLVPSLSKKDIKLGSYNLDKSQNIVLSCISDITHKSKKDLLSETFYDDLLKINHLDYQLSKNNIELSNGSSLKLIGSYSYNHKGDSFSEVSDNYFNEGERQKAVGIRFNIPFGSVKSTTSKAIALEKYKLRKEEKKIINILENSRESFLRSTHYLNDLLKLSKRSDRELKVKQKEIMTKWEQARVSIEDVYNSNIEVNNNNISSQQIKLLILKNLLNYFKVYTKSSCEFNAH